MEYIVLSVLAVCVYFFLRSFSFAMTHVSMYNYRDGECIERILKQQKACDLVNAAYQFFVMSVTACMVAEGIMLLLDATFIKQFNIVSLAVATVGYIAFFALKIRTETKHGLRNFYNDMVDYRARQEVVTQDNDHEVSFIMSYRKTMNHKVKMNLWYVAFLALFLSQLL